MRGGCGGMAVDVFVTVSRGDCLWKVSAASVELSLQPSSKQRAIQFLSVSLSTHAEDTRGPPPPPPKRSSVSWWCGFFVCPAGLVSFPARLWLSETAT